MSQATKDKRTWRSIFRRVMSHYDELKSVQGTNSCQAFYNAISQEGRGSSNPKLVRVSPSDFICDVEIAARRALTEEEHRLFMLVYLNKDSEIADYANKEKSVKYEVQEKLGRVFQQRNIYPVRSYFRPKEVIAKHEL